MEHPEKPSSRSSYVAAVMTFVMGGLLTASLLITLYGPTYRQVAESGAYAAEEKKVWGHHLTEAPETAVQCSANLLKLHAAIKAYEKEHGYLPVATKKGNGLLGLLLRPYLGRDASCLICPADPTKGLHYGDKEHPQSYLYGYSEVVFERNHGRKLPLAPDSPLVLCRHHTKGVLILRYDGTVELAPEGRYSEIRVRFADEPKQGATLGSLSHTP